MANRYWVGGTGNWSDNTNHWSATSGGSPGASLPTSSDNVFIDSSSGLSGGTITVDMDNASCNDFSSTLGSGYVFNTNTYGFYFYGSVILESGITFPAQDRIHFVSTTTGKTITSAGVDIYSPQFEGVGGGWTLQDNLTLTGQFYQENGTFDANDHNVTANDFSFYADTGYTPTFIMNGGIFSPTRPSWVLDEHSGVTVTIIDLCNGFVRIPKPTGSTYTRVNPQGKEEYDCDLTYDSSVTYYDSVDESAWGKTSKPTGSTWTKVTKPV